jgi:hypothetical protein
MRALNAIRYPLSAIRNTEARPRATRVGRAFDLHLVWGFPLNPVLRTTAVAASDSG